MKNTLMIRRLLSRAFKSVLWFGQRPFACTFAVLLCVSFFDAADGQELLSNSDSKALLERFDFWDNRDWDWYKSNIPFLETPDEELDATYYYRWEVVTKHMTYGSPKSGYSFTEFIDRPFWSGTYGAISCPAGHQLYEVRWLRDVSYAKDYARYWFKTPGAQPRNYSTWLADSIWAIHLVQEDAEFATELLEALVSNYKGWEQRHYVADRGLFWQTGHDDGMEFNINSRQTQDILRGAPSYRPSFNAYMYADAKAISRIAKLAGRQDIVDEFEAKSFVLKQQVQTQLWDAEREFFFPMFRDSESKDGFTIQANTLTYQSGQHAGSPHGRELIGYVPWQFNMPDEGFEGAWRFLMDEKYFAAPYGPTVTERNDPMFLVTDHCCWWSGQSWPYATTQTLVAMANLLNNYSQDVISKDDYWKLLKTYVSTHRKDGQPYIAEAANPDTGSWQGYDNYNHSEHYFHSGFCDLVISGLVGIRPSDGSQLTIAPLAPETWDYFMLADVPYHGHLVSVQWDRDGTRYGRSKGLAVYVDGQRVAQQGHLGKVTVDLPAVRERKIAERRRFNFAANNDGGFYPQISASFTSVGNPPTVMQDGNYWYHVSPPNRWTNKGSVNESDWITIDFGVPREIHQIALYVLEDPEFIQVPESYTVEFWRDDQWQTAKPAQGDYPRLQGRRANRIYFDPTLTSKVRVSLRSKPGSAFGLTEIEAWGEPGGASLDAPRRPPSLATNDQGGEFPKVSASHTSRFDRVEQANDGVISYRPQPHNRWTAYESKEGRDWLEVEFARETRFGRVELHFYDDRGGVQPPEDYWVEILRDGTWTVVEGVVKSPVRPSGGMMNTITFPPVHAKKLRVVFKHSGASRSGVTEIEVWDTP